MVVIMKREFTPEQLEAAVHTMEEGGVKVMVSKGAETTILGAEGNAEHIDQEKLSLLPGVERVMRVTEPYKKANRKYHPEDTVIELSNGRSVGGNRLAVIAGPCSVESEAQIVGVAQAVKASGAAALRGGAFKPRTSPYAFQGMGNDGIRLLQEAKEATGLPIVTEIMSTDNVEMFEMCVDVIQVGARNMQNFDLLKQLGKTSKPILLKRGLSSTIEEWLMSAEYIMAGGNHRVILCERGIRTFETYTRNTLDLSAVLAVKQLSHLPVVVDPSHACGKAWMVERMSLAAVAAGADGLIIEVHNDPPHALCDGAQSITPAQFDTLMGRLTALAPCVGRELWPALSNEEECAMKQTMLIVGLGLIGGSLALALKGFEDFEIVGVDVSQPTLRYAAEHGVGDRVTEDAAAELPQADVVALALHPQGIVDFLARYRDAFKPGALVWDVCGVKTAILEAAQVLPGTVDFIGCHPMAGTEFSGVEHAFAEMFRDSHFLLVPRDDSRPEHIALLERLAAYIGCKDVCRTTAQAHDALIAYTSQMMHLIAVSVCDDPELFQCRGFEGSSFRGCTRVAALDVGLWTQLFSLNQPALLAAVDRLLDNLQSYRDALASGNRAALAEKLAHSAARKREMDLPGPDLLA